MAGDTGAAVSRGALLSAAAPVTPRATTVTAATPARAQRPDARERLMKGPFSLSVVAERKGSHVLFEVALQGVHHS